MRGNPYYEPDYEKYYYDPPWYDRLQDPEEYHGLNQFSRSAARAVGPFLPFVAAAAPLGAAYYTIRENYNKLQADRLEAEAERMKAEQKAIKKAAEKAEAAEKADVTKDLKRVSSNIKQREQIRLSRENTPRVDASTITGPQREQTPPGNIFDEVEETIERRPMVPSPQRSPKRSPIIRPTIPKLNIPLTAPIKKKANVGALAAKQNKQATKVMERIREVGNIEQVINDPTMRRDYSSAVKILEDIPSALTSPNPYPEAFLDLLNESTLEAYQARRDEAKENKRLIDQALNAERKKKPVRQKKK